MNTGAWVLIASLAMALAFGTYRAFTDGRFRGTHRVRGAVTPEVAADRAPLAQAPVVEPVSVLAGTPWEAEAGDEFTLLQFSSAFCAPCRTTRRVLEDVAASMPGVAHLDVDAEHHLDVVRRLGILRTPTTLILDGDGREIGRASGVPSRGRVLEVLAVG